MRHVSIGVLCVLALVSPSQAGAQTTDGTFIDGIAFLGIENRAHTDFIAPAQSTTNLSGTAVGGGVAAGTHLHPRVSVRFEATFPPMQAVGPAPLTPNSTSTTEQQSTVRAYSALVGYHPASRGRVALAYVAGVVFGHERKRFIVNATSPGAPPLIPAETSRSEYVATGYRASAEVGIDVAIRAGTRVLLVPQIRLLAPADGLSVRPGVAARLAF